MAVSKLSQISASSSNPALTDQVVGVKGGATDELYTLQQIANTVNPSSAALTASNDTNVTLTLGGTPSTALLEATSVTAGWTGTLAAGRLNSNVVQAVTNDTNVTGSIATQDLTLGWTGNLAVARGGTGGGTASGTLLDNITGFSGTGYVKRTGAGAYSFVTDPSDVTSVFTRTGAVTAQSGDYTVSQITGAAPLASPTFTGTPAAPTASAGTNTTQLATTAFVSNFTGYGGFVNIDRNAPLSVWQRGTSALAAAATTVNAYWADGCIMNATYSSGSGPVGSQVANNRTGARSLWALKILGAANVTNTNFRRRYESSVAAQLGSSPVTTQIWVYNGSGASITPQWTVRYAGTTDVWTSPTTDSTVSALPAQACANGAWTQCALTFQPTGNPALGMEISLDFLALVATEYVYLAEFDTRATPGVSTGLNSNPPPPELRPIGVELAFCQRYYAKSYAQGTIAGTATTTGLVPVTQLVYSSTQIGAYGFKALFPVTMRAAPTVTLYDRLGNSGKVGFWTSAGETTNVSSTKYPSDSGVDVASITGLTGLTAGQAAEVDFHYVATAEL